MAVKKFTAPHPHANNALMTEAPGVTPEREASAIYAAALAVLCEMKMYDLESFHLLVHYTPL